MKQILVTQRVEVATDCEERRDALDQRWIDFLLSTNFQLIPVPNHLEYVKKVIVKEKVDGILLTGGNSIARYGGDAPERDEMEHFLLEWAIRSKIPLLGVCRGMQVFQDYFGITLEPVKNHIATRHSLVVEERGRLSAIIRSFPDVNSYHKFGTRTVSGELLPVARSQDDVVMAVEHASLPMLGIMWHPERETPFSPVDMNLIAEFFGNNKG